MRKLVCECKSIVILTIPMWFFLIVVFVIWNLRTTSKPFSILLLICFFRKAKDFHSIIVQWIRFWKIENIELNWLSFRSVSHSEKEPLSVPVRVDIILKNEVVLFIWSFYSKIEVPTFKSWFENKSLIFWTFRNVILFWRYSKYVSLMKLLNTCL